MKIGNKPPALYLDELKRFAIFREKDCLDNPAQIPLRLCWTSSSSFILCHTLYSLLSPNISCSPLAILLWFVLYYLSFVKISTPLAHPVDLCAQLAHWLAFSAVYTDERVRLQVLPFLVWLASMPTIVKDKRCHADAE